MPSSSPESNGEHQRKGGVISEANRLFDEMSDRAKRDIETENEHPALRSPLVRGLLLLTILACLAAAATGFYGVYRFPDAPIRPSDSGYVGRIGKPHTKEDFDAYNSWKSAMFIAFPAAFVFGFSYAIASAIQRRRQ